MARQKDRWVTPDVVADHLGIPRRNQPRADAPKYPTSEAVRKKKAVLNLVTAGELKAIKVSGEWRVRWSSVVAYERRQIGGASRPVTKKKGFIAGLAREGNSEIRAEVSYEAE